MSDEVLVYDLNNNNSYCLNSTAGTLFNHCDGETTFADLNLPDEIIHFALDGLKKQNLIQGDDTFHFAGMNRREVVKKVGLASMIALPVITGLIAPKAANAASGALLANSATCSASSQCQSNICAGRCCSGGAAGGNTACSSINDCCCGGNGLVFCRTNSSGAANRCCFGSGGDCTSTASCCTGLTCTGGTCR